MTFEEYYQTMKEHGICELFFLYNDKECSVFMAIHEFFFHYQLSFTTSVSFSRRPNLSIILQIIFFKVIFYRFGS